MGITSFIMTGDMAKKPPAPIPHKALARINERISRTTANPAVVTANMSKLNSCGNRLPMLSEILAAKGWHVVEVRRKAVSSHGAKFDERNSDVMTGWMVCIRD